jgi:hypothetical protein
VYWRLFDFDLHYRHPLIQRLQLHLPDQQPVYYYSTHQTGQQLLERPNICRTTLTAFFEATRQYPNLAVNLLYPNFPSKFVWNTTSKSWTPRQRGFSVGWVYFVVPSNGERYYLRMLLYNVPSPTSFEDLQTYQGILNPTFQDACLARGLLESDDEWDLCLTEASFIQTGS